MECQKARGFPRILEVHRGCSSMEVRQQGRQDRIVKGSEEGQIKSRKVVGSTAAATES